jgi:succinate-semialdehyde dehydrogenase/glutarate-semialdehyde dehydrogenase
VNVQRSYTTLGLYIDGRWLTGGGRTSQPVYNPATGRILSELPHATADDLSCALEAAKRGFAIWQATTAHARSNILRRAATLMRERSEAIATILTLEQGKILAESRIEVAFSADIFDWYAEEGMRAYGRVVPSRTPNVRYTVLQVPVGPVAAFTPWNVPAVTPARKIGGALAAGCSNVIKAAEETPGTCVEIVRALHDAGLPPGVLNLVFGVPAEVSTHLLRSPVIRKVSFTGSTAVGKALTKLAADDGKRVTMELGGHAPVIVFDDCDVDKAVHMCVAAKFRNAGQVCISPSRFFVQEKIYPDFLRRFTELAKEITLGDGLSPASGMGPLANSRRTDAMRLFIDDAQARGASVMTGGEMQPGPGNFFAPTVVGDLDDDARLMTDEPFGPIAGFATFRDFDEVVHRANALPYGLAGYAFTESLRRANAIGDALEVGMVGINTFAISTPETPFGGIKESGSGSEGGIEGLDSYLVKKLVVQS